MLIGEIVSELYSANEIYDPYGDKNEEKCVDDYPYWKSEPKWTQWSQQGIEFIYQIHLCLIRSLNCIWDGIYGIETHDNHTNIAHEIEERIKHSW